VHIAAAAGGNAAQNNYLKHAERQALASAQKACFADASSPSCGTVAALKEKDRLSDKLLSNAAASCSGSDCNDVTNFIQSQMASVGCTAPNACPDYTTLSDYLRVTQEKAQGVQAVYPESWLMDAKAVLDLGKYGVKVLANAGAGAKGSLDAIGQLAKTDATKVTNNFYAEGASANPAGLSTSVGVIPANPYKTTTVLGTYIDDTKSIIEGQLQLPKNNNINIAQPGGFNLLNTDNALYAKLGPEEYWKQVNRPFLDQAINRGDDIAIATPPSNATMYRNGQLSGFGREIQYLEGKGYKYDPGTNNMIKGN
jgi:filamentous hemagglutinin